MTSIASSSPPKPRNRTRIAFLVYLILLSAVSAWAATSTSLWEHLQWESNASNWVIMAVEHIAVLILRDTILFFPLAFLLSAALGAKQPKKSDAESNNETEDRIGMGRVLLVACGGFLVSLALSLLFKSLMAGFPLHPPSIFVISLLVVICSLGSWAGATWVALRGTGTWVLLQLVTLIVVLGTVVFLLGHWGLEREPMDIAFTPVQSRERIELVRRIQSHAPHRLSPGETTQLNLSETDLQKLITWGLSLLPRDQLASLEVSSDHVSISFSAVMPEIPFFDNVLNVRLAAAPLTKRGELGFAPREFSIGHLQIPGWLLRWSGPIVVDKDWHNDATEPFFAALKSIEIKDEQVSVTYGHLDLPDGFLTDTFVSFGLMEDVGPAMNAQVEALIQLAEQEEVLSFERCFQVAFEQARERTIAGGNAMDENRAAILALGYLLGHPKIGRLSGSQIPTVPREAAKKFGRVQIHGRQDWTRHFTVSAALQVLSSSAASNAIGLMKEELDSDGGSGFSFADLMADYAGTRLGKFATESDGTARSVQRFLSQTFSVDAIMPDASHLPEGLQHDEFIEQFGGVTDPRYQRLVQEIDEAIAKSEIYR